MAQENEYRRKEDNTEEVVEKKVDKKQKKNISVKNPISNFSERFDKKKVKTSLGIGLVLISFYLFLACLSYIFTWKIDQDRVLGKGLFEFLFDGSEEPVENWLGKFGAWTSHLLVYRWFGISSFGICFLIFISGVKVLFNIVLLPIKRTYSVTSLFIVWSSLFLGFFAYQVNFLGGSFGYHINNWLKLSLGGFGAFLLIAGFLYVIVVILFNPNFSAYFDRLFGKNEQEILAEENGIRISNTVNPTDFNVVNTIKDNEIRKESKAQVFFDDDDEEDDDLSDSELEITIKKVEPKFETEPIVSTDDFEIEIAEDSFLEPTLTNTSSMDDTDDFSISVTVPEVELSEDELDDMRTEYGDYDPTLDLASYVLPPIDLLKDFGKVGININKQELEDNKNKIVETLSHYKIDIAKIKATVGPTVTLYEIVPAPGVRISKIKNLEDDIALSLSALGIRIIAPIPGKGTIGIEVPNSNPEMVPMRALIASEKFQNCDYELPVVIGKTITNETYMFDLTKMPHLLVAGATGQGKSVGLNAILVSILYKKHPAQVKFVLVDPKKVELTLFNRIERHFLAKLPGEGDAIITDTSKVVNTMNSLCIEMDDRYELLKNAQVRTIKEYNAKFIGRKLNPEKGHRFMPYIVVLIDEFADLIMTAGKEIEHPIARIAQLARAVGIHLIVATQRPSVNVITGMIKANFPARIAFRVLSKIDSRTILDGSGADQLIGRGDMLIMSGSELVRIQCGFVDTPEVEAICEFIGNQRAYPEALLLPEYVGEGGESSGDFDTNELDPMFADAARLVVIHQQGSASLLQRKLKLGYNRAGRIVDQLEGFNIIGPFQGSKAREVLFSDVTQLDEFLAQKNIF
ncbi:MAG: DNA translocase FtsK 4TM domain-containing protein [Flavobacteriia bacterium]|nr:DNA translocase FtsK 4TM domain-containing protein [Flavobacteriia bacterium]